MWEGRGPGPPLPDRKREAIIAITWFTSTTLSELGLLSLAFTLSAVIGIERHRQVKSAGIRTHTLVGLGSAIFTLVSWYGFVESGHSVLQDPSRIAAQVVSGIGFLGGGVIFVRQNVVSGLTTAASIWVTAAVGMACGAGMPTLAIVATALHLTAVLLLAPLSRRIPSVASDPIIVVRYRDGSGSMRSILGISRELGYETTLLEAARVEAGTIAEVEARFRFTRGNAPLDKLIERLSEVRGVEYVAPPGDDRE